ncbi:MAG: hypothetical protein JXA28_08155 [Bacteroidetes bacterium]|nr:hypothetical protein [Bacteroidota bacterium]
MLKKILLSTLAVFVLWSLLDMILHYVLLAPMYEETSQLWRPMEEMKMHVTYLVGLIVSFCFSAIYGWLVHPKSMRHALLYGLIFGLGAGTSMGYGSYASMPIPYWLAFAWFLGVTVESLLGGLLLGWMVRNPVESQ